MTNIFNKKDFIGMIKQVNDNKIFLCSNTPLKISGATKDRKGKWKTNKSISFQFQNEVFKEPELIKDILQSACFSIILCDKKILSEKVKKMIKKEENRR